MEDLVSIIVPIYNSEQFLKECIEDIQNQSYKNIEIILINDGSTDNSLSICEKAAEKDPRIIIRSQENKGIAAARNLGLDISTGEYISFIDSDDNIPRYYIEKLLEDLKAENADIVMAYTKEILKKDLNTCSYSLRDEKLRAPIEVYNKEIAPFILAEYEMFTVFHSKLFTKQILNTFRTPEGAIFEDIRSMHRYFENANKIVYDKSCEYFYSHREGSVIDSISKTEISRPRIEAYVERIRRAQETENKKLEHTYKKELKKYICEKCLKLDNSNVSDLISEVFGNKLKMYLYF